jgi:hypothetical protein
MGETGGFGKDLYSKTAKGRDQHGLMKENSHPLVPEKKCGNQP